MNRQIVHYPNLILEVPCKEITDFGSFLYELLDDMCKIMNENKGIGIAANQCGESLKAIVILSTHNYTIELINPVILEQDGNIMINEGCLSVPGQYLEIVRPEQITVEYQNRNGEKNKGVFVGIEARIILHEIDHLNGIMFFSKVNRQMRKKVLSNIRKGSKT